LKQVKIFAALPVKRKTKLIPISPIGSGPIKFKIITTYTKIKRKKNISNLMRGSKKFILGVIKL
jgi:hypothetical protein